MRAAQIKNGKVVNYAEVDSFDPAEFIDPKDSKLGSLWDGVAYTDPPPVPPTREELKALRQAAVDAITVEVNGKVFDGDEVSQGRMTRALLTSQLTGIDSCVWVLHDNTAVEVTQAELGQALALSIQAQAAVWVIPE